MIHRIHDVSLISRSGVVYATADMSPIWFAAGFGMLPVSGVSATT